MKFLAAPVPSGSPREFASLRMSAAITSISPEFTELSGRAAKTSARRLSPVPYVRAVPGDRSPRTSGTNSRWDGVTGRPPSVARRIKSSEVTSPLASNARTTTSAASLAILDTFQPPLSHGDRRDNDDSAKRLANENEAEEHLASQKAPLLHREPYPPIPVQGPGYQTGRRVEIDAPLTRIRGDDESASDDSECRQSETASRVRPPEGHPIDLGRLSTQLAFSSTVLWVSGPSDGESGNSAHPWPGRLGKFPFLGGRGGT